MRSVIIYKTTNLINGKIYIGKHIQKYCPIMFDGYLGSGLIIKNAIKKYGKENFERITLESFDNEQSAYEREEYWIEKFNSRNSDVGYNIYKGGWGVSSDEIKERWQLAGYREKLPKQFEKVAKHPK